MKKLIITLFVLAFGIGLSGRAYAATAATTLDVSANSIASCTVTATPVAFGDYVGNYLFANGDVTVNCTTGAAYTISLDAGSNYEAVFLGDRHVCGASAPADCTPYRLFQDAGLLIEWGDAGSTHPANFQVGTGSGLDQPNTVYGQLSASISAPPPGLLTDIVNVTVAY
jgi:spore coat protein U-like protein